MEGLLEYETSKPNQDGRRKVLLVTDSDPPQIKNYFIQQYLNYERFQETICETFQVSRSESASVRIFKGSGVEIFNDDLAYIKNGELLFIFFGEDFDEKSFLAVFKLQKFIGQGGFGKVYEARSRINKSVRVAIKMIDTSKLKSAKEADMIYRELYALTSLSHPHILKIFQCYTLKKDMKVALVLEYLEGGDLRNLLNEKKILNEKEAQHIFKQLVPTIQYCHSLNVIHRDLKLENIMFKDKEHSIVKVVDFGISGRQSLQFIDYTQAGSIRYLAPEVIRTNAPAHPSIDVWALGCILYWILTGNSPFPQNTREAVQDSIIHGKWTFSKSDKVKLSRSVRDLITRILQVNPLQRATMDDIYNHRWMNEQIPEEGSSEEVQETEPSPTVQVKAPSIQVLETPEDSPRILKQKTQPSASEGNTPQQVQIGIPGFLQKIIQNNNNNNNNNNISSNNNLSSRKSYNPAFNIAQPPNSEKNLAQFSINSPKQTQQRFRNFNQVFNNKSLNNTPDSKPEKRNILPQLNNMDLNRRFSQQVPPASMFGATAAGAINSPVVGLSNSPSANAIGINTIKAGESLRRKQMMPYMNQTNRQLSALKQQMPPIAQSPQAHGAPQKVQSLNSITPLNQQQYLHTTLYSNINQIQPFTPKIKKNIQSEIKLTKP